MSICLLVDNIKDYGFLMAYCIDKDICVFRTYWNEKEKTSMCYKIDYTDKRCYKSDVDYYKENGDEIFKPIFSFDEYGKVVLHYISLS